MSNLSQLDPFPTACVMHSFGSACLRRLAYSSCLFPALQFELSWWGIMMKPLNKSLETPRTSLPSTHAAGPNPGQGIIFALRGYRERTFHITEE
jgi:hypothetical protein